MTRGVRDFFKRVEKMRKGYLKASQEYMRLTNAVDLAECELRSRRHIYSEYMEHRDNYRRELEHITDRLAFVDSQERQDRLVAYLGVKNQYFAAAYGKNNKDEFFYDPEVRHIGFTDYSYGIMDKYSDSMADWHYFRDMLTQEGFLKRPADIMRKDLLNYYKDYKDLLDSLEDKYGCVLLDYREREEAYFAASGALDKYQIRKKKYLSETGRFLSDFDASRNNLLRFRCL